MRIFCAKDYEAMSRLAADMLAAQTLLRPDCVLGLATGSTPVGAYKELVSRHKRGELHMGCVRTVNLDEYVGLAPDHPQSYRYFMRKNLFDHIDIPAENTHVPDGLAKDPEAECARYERLISALGGIDLQLLGIGHNGHIGFNEPDASFAMQTHRVALSQSTIDANARFFDTPGEVPRAALTMGIRAIMQARKILVVVSGAAKREIVEKAFLGPVTPAVQASILQLHPDVTLIGDAQALRGLTDAIPQGIIYV